MGVRLLVIAYAAALAMSTAQAAPEGGANATGDAVLQLLHDKGLISATVEPLRQARDLASELVLSAIHFIGVRYRRGGNSADEGFDCSGFTRHVFESRLGLVLPRRADEQARDTALTQVQRNELQPGDLVFFNTMKRAFSHVGIYIGEGKFIHAPRSGAQVRIEDMQDRYWSRRFNGARRAELAAAPGA